MEQLEHEEEEPIVSEEYKHNKRIKGYKQYLVDSGCVMHLIKFLLGVRNKQIDDNSVPSDDVLKMFYEYIGAQEVDTTEFDELKKMFDEEKEEGIKVREEIEKVKIEIEEVKLRRQKADEEKRLKEEEELAKNTKKGGKK